MKKVEATINPSRLEEVRDALVELGITGMTVSEIRAYHPPTHSNWYRGAEYTVSFTPRVKIETLVDEGHWTAASLRSDVAPMRTIRTASSSSTSRTRSTPYGRARSARSLTHHRPTVSQCGGRSAKTKRPSRRSGR